ncbi:hypothetical protein [uncultured Draconibacterium sp.]|uniref:hypothetical protein n=1 Tax=uncultured Draconibacterium sp. TaxID=1573823 RepID=UPI0032606D67
MKKPKSDFIPAGVNIIYSVIDRIEADANKVHLGGGKILNYDFLIVATGTKTFPEETAGLREKLWYKEIFDFYTVEGAMTLQKYFKGREGGKLVMSITELPYKCLVTPLEFVFFSRCLFYRIGYT